MNERVKSVLAISGTLLVLIVSGCASRAAGGGADMAARRLIAARLEAMESCVRMGDMAGVAAFHADDAVLVSPRGSRVSGRSAIDSYWAGFGRGIDWRLEIHSTEGDGAVYTQRGTSHLTHEKEGRKRKSTVEFVLVWFKAGDGEFLIVMDAYW